MVNTKTKSSSRRNWLSDNIMGVLIAALLTAVFGFQAVQSSQDYQDKVLQTATNQQILLSLQELSGNSVMIIDDLDDLTKLVEDNCDEIDDLDGRVIVLETKNKKL